MKTLKEVETLFLLWNYMEMVVNSNKELFIGSVRGQLVAKV